MRRSAIVAPSALGALVGLSLVACAHATPITEEEIVPSESAAIERALSARPDYCQADVLESVPPRAWRASEGGPWLVYAPCILGAYQPEGGLYRVRTTGEVEPVALPLVSGTGSADSTVSVGSFELDAASRLATERYLARGLGDCGRRVVARLEADASFTLVEHRDQPCVYEGEPVVDAAQWPLRVLAPATE